LKGRTRSTEGTEALRKYLHLRRKPRYCGKSYEFTVPLFTVLLFLIEIDVFYPLASNMVVTSLTTRGFVKNSTTFTADVHSLDGRPMAFNKSRALKLSLPFISTFGRVPYVSLALPSIRDPTRLLLFCNTRIDFSPTLANQRSDTPGLRPRVTFQNI
jgi:hypothetical protein